MLDAVIVPGPAEFAFEGAVSRAHAEAAWSWMSRELAPALLSRLSDAPEAAVSQLADLMPELLAQAEHVLDEAAASVERERRLVVQLGGPEAHSRLPAVLQALRSRRLIDMAQRFGRAANAMTGEAALSAALRSIPITDPFRSALFMQAAIGQICNPGTLVAAAIQVSGGATGQALARGGFIPMIDAILAHAQAQIPQLAQQGSFADIDLACRSLHRFHRLMRAVTGQIEIGRFSRWSAVTADLTTAVSAQIDARLRHVVRNVDLALQMQSGPNVGIEGDLVLEALNSCYLLAAVRDCRDSLAVGTMFARTWSQLGQSLEEHLRRHLAVVRDTPADRIARARLDAAIKMAELRFNGDYADTIRQMSRVSERRVG